MRGGREERRSAGRLERGRRFRSYTTVREEKKKTTAKNANGHSNMACLQDETVPKTSDTISKTRTQWIGFSVIVLEGCVCSYALKGACFNR